MFAEALLRNSHLGLCFSLCRLHLFGGVIVQLCIVVWEWSRLDLQQEIHEAIMMTLYTLQAIVHTDIWGLHCSGIWWNNIELK